MSIEVNVVFVPNRIRLQKPTQVRVIHPCLVVVVVPDYILRD